MILVTGATGNVGSEVVRLLAGDGQPVRAFVRDGDRARATLGDVVEFAVGDFGDRASIERAMAGVEAVFLTSANGWDEVAHETAVIDAAATSGVRWLVKLSGFGAEAGSPLPALDWHGQIERHLRASAVPSVVLQANFFMTNLLAAAPEVKATGQLVAPAGTSRISMIDPRDVAAAAVALLTSGAPEGETVVVTGPEAITYEQIAAQLSAATGQAIEFVDVPAAAARQAMGGAGMPDWMVDQIDGLFARAKRGALAHTTDSVQRLTGSEPRTFAQFARDHARAFAPAVAALR